MVSTPPTLKISCSSLTAVSGKRVSPRPPLSPLDAANAMRVPSSEQLNPEALGEDDEAQKRCRRRLSSSVLSQHKTEQQKPPWANSAQQYEQKAAMSDDSFVESKFRRNYGFEG